MKRSHEKRYDVLDLITVSVFTLALCGAFAALLKAL